MDRPLLIKYRRFFTVLKCSCVPPSPSPLCFIPRRMLWDASTTHCALRRWLVRRSWSSVWFLPLTHPKTGFVRILDNLLSSRCVPTPTKNRLDKMHNSQHFIQTCFNKNSPYLKCSIFTIFNSFVPIGIFFNSSSVGFCSITKKIT